MNRAGIGRAGGGIALSALALMLSAAPALAVDDAQIVHCLSKSQQPALREAALSLGKAASPDQVADLAAWRARDPDAFAETCEALYESAKPQPGLLNDLMPVLTTLGAAALAYWAARAHDGRIRRRASAQALSSAFVEFELAAHAFTKAVANPPVDRLRAAHSALAARLLDVLIERPRWPLARTCHDTLTTGALKLSDLIDTRNTRTAELAELQESVRDLVAGLARRQTRSVRS